MRDAGLARNVAVAARDMYKAAAATGIMGRDVAVARLKLMNEILKKWWQMSKDLLIRNNSSKLFRVMLEPVTFSDDVSSGRALLIGNVSAESVLHIDIGDAILISVWAVLIADLKLLKWKSDSSNLFYLMFCLSSKHFAQIASDLAIFPQ